MLTIFLVDDGPGFEIGPNDGAFFLGSEDARGVPSGVTTLEETKGGACLLSCLWCVFVSSKFFFFEGAAICCGLGGGVCKFVGCV